MSDLDKHDSTTGQAGYERLDISAKGVLYFFLSLAAGTVLIVVFLAGMYTYLDKRERGLQPTLNPLATNVPTDTRSISEHYPEHAFPNPRLETDERTQLNEDRLKEDGKLDSYGWADEKAGTIHIPIERAMDLIAQRGLGEHSQAAHVQPAQSAPKQEAAVKAPAARKGKKK